MRHRREKRAVGFDEQTVEGHHAGHFVELRRTRKGNDAGQREVKSSVQGATGHRTISGKTVEYPSGIARRLVQDAKRVFLGFPGVENDRKAPPAGEEQLQPENLLLHVARGEIVVVVEAYF